MTRPKMYQTVREALDQECTRTYAEGLAALAALEAGDRDTERLLNVARGCHDYGGGYRDTKEAEIFHHGIATVINALTAFAKAPGELQVRVLEGIGASTTPPAPPATEAIVTAFAREFFVRHDHTYSGIEIYEWLKKQATGPAAPPAAECAAQVAWEPEDFLRAFFGSKTKYVKLVDIDFKANASSPDTGCAAKLLLESLFGCGASSPYEEVRAALAPPCECQRLRDDKCAATDTVVRLSKALDNAAKMTALSSSKCFELSAELRQAVDALRRIREAIGVALTGTAAPIDFRAEIAKIDVLLAAYDAKHGEGERTMKVMNLEPGWLNRQFDRVAVDVATWPEYMRRECGDDSCLTELQRKRAAALLRKRADELDPPAKRGDVPEPDAPVQEYSECPNCHVKLHRSATDTHERRHEIREGGEAQHG